MQIAGDPHLVRREPVVPRRVAPVDVRDPRGLLLAVVVAPGREVAVAEQVVDLAVRPRRRPCSERSREIAAAASSSAASGAVRVQRAQRREQAMLEDDVATAVAPERPARAERLLVGVDGLSSRARASSSTAGRSTSSSSVWRRSVTIPPSSLSPILSTDQGSDGTINSILSTNRGIMSNNVERTGGLPGWGHLPRRRDAARSGERCGAPRKPTQDRPGRLHPGSRDPARDSSSEPGCSRSSPRSGRAR